MNHKNDEPQHNPAVWGWMMLWAILGIIYALGQIFFKYPNVSPWHIGSLFFFIVSFSLSAWKVTRS